MHNWEASFSGKMCEITGTETWTSLSMRVKLQMRKHIVHACYLFIFRQGIQGMIGTEYRTGVGRTWTLTQWGDSGHCEGRRYDQVWLDNVKV
jgi:hypothetical protein